MSANSEVDEFDDYEIDENDTGDDGPDSFDASLSAFISSDFRPTLAQIDEALDLWRVSLGLPRLDLGGRG